MVFLHWSMFCDATCGRRTGRSTATSASRKAGGCIRQVVQRRVLYLGEINDSQQAAWRKTLEVVGERNSVRGR